MTDSGSPTGPHDTPRGLRAASFAAALEDLEGDPIARRDFLVRMGAAIALAGIGGCTRAPREEIVPYVTPPPEVKPGVPRHYATACVLDGYATGIVVESHAGRPTKIEGNPSHPASLGAAGAFEQASVLSLYDPTRARGVRGRGTIATWEETAHALSTGSWVDAGGRGLHLHLEPTSSPTVLWLVDAIRRRYPGVAVSYAPAASVNAWEGSRSAFARVLEPRFDLERADVIVALDGDFLSTGPASLLHARHFAGRRAIARPDAMNRLYVAEPLVTVTGANADHRLAVRAADVRQVAASLAAAVKLPALSTIPPHLVAPRDQERRWVEVAARDLIAHRGRSLVIVGDSQPPEVHALAYALNAALGNVGTTVTFAPSPIAEAGAHGATALRDALAAGAVDMLIVFGSNPVYASPPSADLARLFARARQSAYLGLHADETAAACTFAIARAHALESWGDARAFDGTLSIVQPLIEPLFGGRTEIEILALLAGMSSASAYELVRSRFAETALERFGGASAGGPTEVDRAWRKALARGIVEGSAIAASAPSIDEGRVVDALARALSSRRAPPVETAGPELEVVSRLDPHVHDGRFANNAWLLELPSPIEKLTWTNAATLSVNTAARLGVTSGEEIELRSPRGEASVRAPACVVPGQADGTVGLSLGWGRTYGAELAHGRGANAFVLGETATVAITKTGVKRDLPITQTQRKLEGRDDQILRHRTVSEETTTSRGTAPTSRRAKRQLALYDREPGPSAVQWAMAIDLSRCTGCGACVIACQAENNVPTVGADNVVLNREMHWLRIDSYISGDPSSPQIAPQPMLCQHCEAAPCEYVCPVNATVHSPDGLNEMVYNRCVGTRFCSNNCPYKVRRFNWFDFHRGETATQELVHNPDVTVRERGVMEKCTFCVQRLREWDIKKQHRAPQSGASLAYPQTACQQTCPTQAIVFGDLHAPGSAVKRLHEDARAYGALEELGTEPRVRYLARITNPNPELE
jgi:Fe-S-cluster-containing dehydrogenase component/anaerobic selenocysteine-containing dehydrogenase